MCAVKPPDTRDSQLLDSATPECCCTNSASGHACASARIYFRFYREKRWCATIGKSARVASRSNITRPIVVVFPFFFLLWFAGREAPGLSRFQLFRNLSINRRLGGLAYAAQD